MSRSGSRANASGRTLRATSRDLSKAAVPVLIRGLVAQAVVLMKLFGDLIECGLHLLKPFHLDNAASRFLGESCNAAVGFVSKDVKNVLKLIS